MKLKDLIEKYGDLEVNENTLELLIKDPKNIDYSYEWIPDEDETYWYIDSMGDVEYSNWYGDESDWYLFTVRNIYRTEEEAKKSLEMHKFCYSRSCKPEWKKTKRLYFLVLDEQTRTSSISYHDCVRAFEPYYFETEEIVQEIIDTYTFNELEKYYGRV